jgi:hypothetical protein
VAQTLWHGYNGAHALREAVAKGKMYWHEMAFGWRATPTWADEYALLLKTIQFHIRNGFGRACDTRSTVTIDLWIDRDRPTTLTLRPVAGDLFVLYEVLAFNAYHIAPSLLPLARCGRSSIAVPISASHHYFSQPAIPVPRS